MMHGMLPPRQGLYDPANEHDACGVGFVANVKGLKSHQIIEQGLRILVNLTHRGAVGADPLAGDGAGILMQIPDALLREECAGLGIELPPVDDYGVGMLFLPQPAETRSWCETLIEQTIAEEGQTLLGWRDVPVDNSGLGEGVKKVEPVIRQVFIGKGADCGDTDCFERTLFIIRKRVENAVRDSGKPGHECFYVPSMSARTICYKGMLLASQVGSYYADLRDGRMVSALALVHQRFSTNTFPSWDLAQPFRMIAHNGEINTLRGNINWMNARRHSMASELFGDDLQKLWPLIAEGQSDSACFDNALELLVTGGYPMAHAMMLLIPEAWTGNPLMDEKRRAFYEYHAAVMEPWDGPAAVAFTDGRQIGATLDRNGLRPARYLITDDDLVVMASEMGVLDIPEERIVKKWRLQPGKMFLIDMEQGRIIDDEELKESLSGSHPYQDWLDKTQIRIEDLPGQVAPMAPDSATLLDRQQAFGYTQEDVKFLMTPMALTGQEAVGSMGADNPVAVLSNKPKPLSNYFKQNFAQVTNPPIDPIREELVMSLVSLIGPRPNLLGLESAGEHMRLEVSQPILTNTDIERIRHIKDHTDNAFRTSTLDICYPADRGADGMQGALDTLCRKAEQAVSEGYNILILSDRNVDADHVAIPALLATASVHHHLVRAGLRTESGLVVETGAAREVHQFATLAGYGAEAINPYLAFETLESIRLQLPGELDSEEVQKRYIKAIGKGLLKVMSKMGISTYQSYCGAQIFDAVGLSSAFIEDYFTGTATTIEGIGLLQVAQEVVRRHAATYSDNPIYKNMLDVGGIYQYRLRGEEHAWTPANVASLQHAVRGKSWENYEAFANSINDQSERMLTIRGLMELKPADKPLDISEVEPAENIVKRFATGAMSYGSISWEAHTTLAMAMNRIGGKSNTGEGGEDPHRFLPLENGDSMRSAIKQVASGPLRRDHRVPGQLRRHPDQDGAGRQAGRRRPAARPQGRRHHREGRGTRRPASA